MRTSLLEHLLVLRPVMARAHRHYSPDQIIKKALPHTRITVYAKKIQVQDDYESCWVTTEDGVEVWLDM